MRQRSGRIGRGEQSTDGDTNPAAVPPVRRAGLNRVEAKRIQRIPRGAVRDEECELAAAHDLAVRNGVLLVGPKPGSIRVRGVLVLRVGVHDLYGEVATESGGGDREGGEQARDSDVRIPEIQSGHGGAEGGAGRFIVVRREDHREVRKLEVLLWCVEVWNRERNRTVG